tara:strand:- start:610 stop:786 length:177 start_codon:yes stop_codon:yes gene_type:complete
MVIKRPWSFVMLHDCEVSALNCLLTPRIDIPSGAGIDFRYFALLSTVRIALRFSVETI